MAYSNSPLVSYTKLSPNHSGQRTHSIDRITPHCVVGQLSAESICGCFASTSRQASCNYGIGKDGKISLCVEEKNRSWCSSSNANDQRAITIECASDKSEPYAMNSAVYASLIKLCTDICQRNGKRKLLWLGDKNKTLNYAPASDEMVLTVHRWYANKSCPGDWLYARLGDLAEKVTAALNDSPGLQAADLENLTRAETVAKIGPLFTANQKTTGILACVSMAQFILESSYTGDVLVQKSYTADYLSHEVRKNKGEVQQYYIKDHHPAIVSRELFEKVQKIVNAKSDSHKREEKTQWAFSGRLICGSCGRFFNVRNRNLNPIWFCPSAKQNNGKSICHAESVYEEQIVRVIRRAVIERFQLSSAPIRDDVSVADIMSGRYAENTDFLTHEADDFVIQMQARLENLQKIDFMERDRCFYKKQIIALQKDAEAAHKRMSLLQSQKDAMETRRDLLGDETIDEAALTERKEEIERLRKRIEQDETEAQKLEDKLDYLEDYWDELEDDYDRREEAVQWMRQLPKGREGTVAFLNGLTGEHCKAFILSITVYSPLKYSVHWFDDTRTKVEMDSNIEDFRNTASYYDGQVMRDNAYRKRFIK